MKEEDYEKDLTINKDSLDREWLNQSGLFFRYARKAAKAEANAKRAKENLAVVDAEVLIFLRNKYDATGEKYTEASLKAAVAVSGEHKKATKEFTDALEESMIISAAVEALNQKKSALENLVKLHLAGYFSSPADIKDDDTTNKAFQAASDRGNKALSEKLKKKNK